MLPRQERGLRIQGPRATHISISVCIYIVQKHIIIHICIHIHINLEICMKLLIPSDTIRIPDACTTRAAAGRPVGQKGGHWQRIKGARVMHYIYMWMHINTYIVCKQKPLSPFDTIQVLCKTSRHGWFTWLAVRMICTVCNGYGMASQALAINHVAATRPTI